MLKKLEALAEKAMKEGNWALAAAAQFALTHPDSLDAQINVVGAIHEAGKLKNVSAPFLKAWRVSSIAWATRCLERLDAVDTDAWAVAALLGLDVGEIKGVLRSKYECAAVHQTDGFKSGPKHVATLVKTPMPKIWAPVLELGWEQKTRELIDVARYRAVSFDSEAADLSRDFKGTGHLMLRASAPHGSWRVVNLDFDLKAAALVKREDTALG